MAAASCQEERRGGIMSFSRVLTCLVVVGVGVVVEGLYFHIGETERKCFIEEIPDETMVTGKAWRGEGWADLSICCVCVCVCFVVDCVL